jgi:hypothetical protein
MAGSGGLVQDLYETVKAVRVGTSPATKGRPRARAIWDREMTPATVTLHEALIRLLKGAVSAWERWLTTQKQK